MIVGYDLGHTCSQISYYSADTKKVETASSISGAQMFQIPTVLCKRYGVNQWLYGREAIRAANQEEGILIDNLLQLAIDGEPLQIEEVGYDPVALLGLFLKRSLGLLSHIGTIDRIGAFLITCETMDERLLEVLKQALATVNLKARHICFQSYEESFYQYMIHQPLQLREFETLMFRQDRDQITVYRQKCNERTSPKAVFMETQTFSFPVDQALLDSQPQDASPDVQMQQEKMDSAFTELAASVCADNRISSVYLMGELFHQDWMKESVRFLCKGRRVFLGSNLYSQGACLGMMERIRPSEAGKETVLLGTGKLKANIGMKVLRRGEESYCALLNAGTDFMQAEGECEFYLDQGESFEIVVTPLDGRKGKVARMMLEGLPQGIARVHLRLYLKEEDLLVLEVKDLGFGEFRQATGQVWKEEWKLS